MYKILYAADVEKDLRQLPKELVRQILDRIKILLANNPFAGEKLNHRSMKLFRYRVRDYRIIYTVDTQAMKVFVFRIRHRKEVYRGL